MDKKDIALTVGGVVATMALAYLFYKLQQRDSAAAAAATQAAADEATQAAQQAQLAQSSAAYQEQATAAYYPSVSTPSLTGTGSDADLSSSVTTSSGTADQGDTGTTIDSTGIDNLLSQIISTFAGSLTSGGTAPETVASMTIPTITSVSGTDLSGIPVTAQQAAQEAAPPITASPSPVASPITYSPGPGQATCDLMWTNPDGSVGGCGGGAPFQGFDTSTPVVTSSPVAVPVSMQTGPSVTSHPVAAHPITAQPAEQLGY